MWDFLTGSIDPGRLHNITEVQQWHARMMFVGWGMLAPIAIIIARFFKVIPGQDWPNSLDNQRWWHSHWIIQTLVLLATVAAIILIYRHTEPGVGTHGRLGYVLLGLVLLQALLGCFRGSKGGPSCPNADGSINGDHYNMTRHRRLFELLHKTFGYIAFLLGVVTIIYGFWLSNAPRWMWLVSAVWWCMLIVVFIHLQRRGLALDTYQAIWGPDGEHPGNQITTVGWGMKRHKKNSFIKTESK